MTQYLFQTRLIYKDGMPYWRYSGTRTRAGDRAGYLQSNGYRVVRFSGRLWKEHRVIWIMHNGPIPEGLEIDHRDEVKDNNQIDNLRLATHGQNQANTSGYKNNTSGIKGVSWRKNQKKWVATIQLNGIQKCLGAFETPEAAAEVYKTSAKALHGEFAKY